MATRYDVTVYYTDTDRDQYYNVELTDSNSPNVMSFFDADGTLIATPLFGVRKIEATPTEADDE